MTEDSYNHFYFKAGSHPLIGKRIRLVHTNDIYTELKKGDLGTITDVNYCSYMGDRFVQIGVKWDSGSNLMLLGNKDKYEVLEK